MLFLREKKFQRWFLIILTSVISGASILLVSYYSVSLLETKQSLSEANSKIASLTSSQDRLKEDYKAAQDAVTQKDQELTAKKKSLDDLQVSLTNLEKDLKIQQDKIANQEAQLTANSQELDQLRNRPALFSFQNESSHNVDSAKADVETVVRAAYTEIQNVYSTPYLLKSVTITFVDSLSRPGASGEITITNSSQGLAMEIRLTDFDKNNFQSVNTIIHEIIHSFHGLAALDPVAFEEGITVAATDKVMKNLAEAGKLPRFSQYYIRISDDQYNNYNSSITIPSDYDAFYGDNVAINYQVEGYAWQKLANSSGNFYKDFNEKFYSKIRSGEKASADLVRQAIKETVSTVDGQPIDDFLNSNKAFQPN